MLHNKAVSQDIIDQSQYIPIHKAQNIQIRGLIKNKQLYLEITNIERLPQYKKTTSIKSIPITKLQYNWQQPSQPVSPLSQSTSISPSQSVSISLSQYISQSKQQKQSQKKLLKLKLNKLGSQQKLCQSEQSLNNYNNDSAMTSTTGAQNNSQSTTIKLRNSKIKFNKKLQKSIEIINSSRLINANEEGPKNNNRFKKRQSMNQISIEGFGQEQDEKFKMPNFNKNIKKGQLQKPPIIEQVNEQKLLASQKQQQQKKLKQKQDNTKLLSTQQKDDSKKKQSNECPQQLLQQSNSSSSKQQQQQQQSQSQQQKQQKHQKQQSKQQKPKQYQQQQPKQQQQQSKQQQQQQQHKHNQQKQQNKQKPMIKITKITKQFYGELIDQLRMANPLIKHLFISQTGIIFIISIICAAVFLCFILFFRV